MTERLQTLFATVGSVVVALCMALSFGCGETDSAETTDAIPPADAFPNVTLWNVVTTLEAEFTCVGSYTCMEYRIDFDIHNARDSTVVVDTVIVEFDTEYPSVLEFEPRPSGNASNMCSPTPWSIEPAATESLWVRFESQPLNTSWPRVTWGCPDETTGMSAHDGADYYAPSSGTPGNLDVWLIGSTEPVTADFVYRSSSQ